VLLLVLVASPALAGPGFERVPLLEPNVKFWRKVYAVWSGNQIAFHDTRTFDVYRVVRVPARGKKVDGLTRSQTIQKAKKELITALANLEKKKKHKSCDGLSGLEKEVCDNLKGSTRPDKYTRTGATLRAQNGLYERSRKGWISFGRYEKDVRRELRKSGLPEELIALAFLESLYNIRAESVAHAVGMWQFLKPTARDYMHVNHVIDERVDPVIATISATKYLRQSRKRLGAWPLAITSYNIGRAGMARGVKATGSKDLGVIIQNYKKKSFGFAAKNYYATFIALQDVIKNPNAYFPGVRRQPHWQFDVVRLPFDVTVPQIVKTGAIDLDTFKMLNPALTRQAREGRAVLPRGFSLRVSKNTSGSFLQKLGTIGKRQRQKNSLHVRAWHKANGRQTIKTIAKRYKADPDVVAAMAGMEVAEKPAKGQRVPIPSSKVGYTLLPEARGMKVPGAPVVKPLVASKIEPPSEEELAALERRPKKAKKREPPPPKGPTVRLVRLTSKPVPKDVPVVDAIAGGEGIPALVDAVAGPRVTAEPAEPLEEEKPSDDEGTT
jgi:membrane-bound lytic murein transglycosylase D